MNYTINDISKIINGQLHSIPSSFTTHSIPIKYLVTDSRKLFSPENSIFFALHTKTNDGHKYIHELFRKGLHSFVVSQLPNDVSEFINTDFIIVPDVLKALQALTAYHRRQFKYPVIAITGSNGKTIIKEWLYQLLSPDRKIVKSPKSYNSQIGVPLSAWLMDSNYDLAIFEAGISQPGEMDSLHDILQPDIGIFSNIGHAHEQNFINKNQKIVEKLKLFSNVKQLIYCSDHSDIKDAILSQITSHPELSTTHSAQSTLYFTWGTNSQADLQIQNITKNNNETTIIAQHNSNLQITEHRAQSTVTIPFTDDASIENAIHCWCLMLLLKYDNAVIAKRMKLLSPVEMRLELKEGINDCSLIDDYYNLDIDSLIIALDFLSSQKQHPNKTVILSDILQSGKNQAELYSSVAKLLKDKNVTRLIGIGKDINAHRHLFDNLILQNTEHEAQSTDFYSSTQDFLNSFHAHSFHNETILIKGARPFQFELISNLLQQRTHQTVLEINLNALIHNLNFYRSLLKPKTKILAMVKAFSYGSGSFEIANALQFHNIDYLAVAYIDEAVELRKSGITTPVIVMNPENLNYELFFKYNLEPEIYNFHTLEQLTKALKKNLLDYDYAISVHLKFDTGMHRLGFDEKDIPALVEYLEAHKQIYVKSVFSHLTASSDSRHDEFTELQFKRYISICDKFEALSTMHYAPFMRHILNSAGIVRFPEMQFDMVRLGIGLYGVPSTAEEQKNLENVSSLKTVISQVKQIPAGDTIGYGREFLAERNMKIAVLPVGYADGLSRSLSNGKGKLMLKGSLAPIVGNISMDMCMIDITGIDAAEGDEVIVFGNEYPVSNIASQLNTIPYEVLTSVSRRVKRVYFQE